MSKELLIKTNILVSVKESHLLSDDIIDRLIHTMNFEEAKQLLSETIYADYFKGEEPLHLETIMETIRADVLQEGYLEAEELPELVDFFSALELFHNLKCILKETVTGTPLRDNYLKGPRYSTQSLETLVKTKKSADLPMELEAAVNRALEDYEEQQSLKRLEVIVDRYYYEYLLRLAQDVEDQTVKSFIENCIDCYNISVLLQLLNGEEEMAELAFVDGGKQSRNNMLALQKENAESVAQYFSNTAYQFIWENSEGSKNMESFDISVDNFLIEKAIKAKIQPFGVLPFVGYMFAKLIEIKNLRIILFAKQSGLAPDKIEKRMRIRYEL